MSRLLFLCVLCATLFSRGTPAQGKPAPEKQPAAADDATVDISAVRDKLVIVHDGKQHYIAVVPFGDTYEHLYYGDGKHFYGQRVSGGSRSGDTEWNRVFWEPRVDVPWKGSIGFRDGKYSVQCGSRATEFQPLPADEQGAMLKAAAFAKPLWSHQAYALARDNKGTYYFVDRLREPENSKAFRLFAGPRGSLKLMKMTNVVSDSQGDIFSTKKGELRLVLDRMHPVWAAGKAETALVNLPLDENRVMIYTDLGVYAGQRLGTPCDDLL
jgi:hypothetical protein